MKNRNKIWEGLRNKIFKQEHIELVSKERLEICRTNTCGYHDPKGESDAAVHKGHESCGACGCRLDLKTRSLSSDCGLKDLGKEPLWIALVSKQDEEMIDSQIKNHK